MGAALLKAGMEQHGNSKTCFFYTMLFVVQLYLSPDKLVYKNNIL